VNPQQALKRPATRHSNAHAPFPLSPVAALVAGLAGMALLGSGAAHAADEAVQVAQAQTDAAKPADGGADQPQQLGGVTVRSRNRIEKLQDVPLSVSVVTGAELERLNAYGVDAITKRAANVSWNLGNQRTSSLSIRGVGKIGQTEAQDPSVGVIYDGVNYAYNALTSSFDFVDIDTIEVARGPQGTLLGKNTSLGVISVNTKKPSFTPTADYSLSFNQRNGFLGTLAAGGPVIDDLLAWRGVFSVNRQQGDIVNAYNRDQTYTNTDRVSGRVKFLFTPTPDVSALISLDRQPRAGETTNGRTINLPTPATFSNGALTNSLVNTAAAVTNDVRLGRSWFTQNPGYSAANYYYGSGGNYVSNDSQRPLVTGSQGGTAEVNVKLGGGFTLTSISAYKDYHFNAVNDEGTPFDVARNSGGFFNDYRQVSQELRINSPLGGFVDYQGGLYFIKVGNTSEYQRVWGNDAGAWYANNAQYASLNATPAGQLLMLNSLANLSMDNNSPTGLQRISNKSGALFGQANWHLTEPLTLTTGLRLTEEHRYNDGTSFIINQGNGAALNPVAVNGVQLGGFNSTGTGVLAAGNSAAQIALANSVAQQYFGVADYNNLTAAQKQQVASAKTLRASQIGVLFPNTSAQPFKKLQPAFVISPSYKFGPDLTGYISYQHGEKAGIAQLVNGVSSPVKPEKTNSFELGAKTLLLDKTLVFNADVFLMNIKDYQQSVRVVDQYTTALNNLITYTSATGNAPKVQVKGLEVDGVYGGIRHTTLRFSGAYNKAIYKEFTNSAQPSENGYPGAAPYRDVSGQTLAGAPKYTFNLGGDYRLPVWGSKEFHTSANLAFTSSFNSDVSLSTYAVIPKNFLVDYAIGLGNLNKSFDVSIVVKNLFDNRTPVARTWTSISPQVPRTAGIVFTGKL
jgi:outer membrane receptor protein involved in Fe transport